MYNYENDFNISAEDMIKEYMEFKNTRDSKKFSRVMAESYKQNYLEALQNEDDYVRVYDGVHAVNDKWFPEPLTENEHEYDWNNFRSKMYEAKHAEQKSVLVDEDDMDYLKSVSSEIVHKLLPYINYEVDKMDYDGSPIYEPNVSKDLLNRMADEAFESVCDTFLELSLSVEADIVKTMSAEEEETTVDITKLNMEKKPRPWTHRQMTKDLLHQLMLIEIFGRRRPRHKKMGNYDYRYYN